MCQIVFSIPDEVLFDTKMTREQAKPVCQAGSGTWILYPERRIHWILFTDCRDDRRRVL